MMENFHLYQKPLQNIKLISMVGRRGGSGRMLEADSRRDLEKGESWTEEVWKSEEIWS